VESAQNSGFIESPENGYRDLSKLPPVYRGGDSMVPGPDDFNFSTNPDENSGISLSTNAASMIKRFGKAKRIISLPEGLAIKQTGSPQHYEIVATRYMKIEEFIELLKKVITSQ
jgi:hypothetical protein